MRWAPDGTWAARGESVGELAGGEPVIELPAGSWIGWSADSRFVAMEDESGETPRILAWDRNTGDLLEQASATEGVWSNTGHRIAYALSRADGTEPGLNEILIAEFPDDPGITTLARIKGLSAQPLAWSHDDAYLVVSVAQPPSDDSAIEYRVAEIHIVDMESG